jgi:hypothetical protein
VSFEVHAGDMAKLLVLWMLVVAAVLTCAGTYGFTACPRDDRLADLQREAYPQVISYRCANL